VIRYLETFFRNRWVISLPALVLLFSGAGLALRSPKTFEASATVWAETSAYLEVSLSRNPYASPASVQGSRFSELVDTDMFVHRIIENTPMGKTASAAEKDQLSAAIHKGMQIGASGEHTVRVRFSHADPKVALAVVQAAISEYNQVTSESADLQAADAIAFYQERVKTYQDQIIPRSKKAVEDYLATHPEVRRQSQEGGPSDPNLVLLQQQFANDRDQYDHFAQKLEEIQVRSAAVSKNQEAAFRIMDPAEVSDANGGKLSKKTIIVFAGLGAGLSLGYVALFLLLATELDQTMRNPGDVRRRLQLPVLEVIPDYSVAGVRKMRKGDKQRARPWMRRAAKPS
jgi:uncharacterized protein involved in exopolysaccharide biosynthesis